MLVAGVAVEPDEQRVGVSLFVVNGGERGERQIRYRIRNSACACQPFMFVFDPGGGGGLELDVRPDPSGGVV